VRVHTVQIGDGAGNSVKVVVSLGYFVADGSWRALDLGLLRYTSGVMSEYLDSDDYDADYSVYLFGPGGTDAGYGIRLAAFDNRISGVNDAGTGTAAQAWVLQLQPGAISWAVLD
jgi:hypothetical protein